MRQLQQVGAPQSLYDDPANRFVAGFIGSPAMNFVDATVSGGKLQAPGITIPVPARFKEKVGSADGRSVVVGFRPEHLDIGTGSEKVATIAAKASAALLYGAISQ